MSKEPIEPKKESGAVANSNEPIERRFRIGLLELIAMCAECGMHPESMAEIMDREIEKIRTDTARVDREGRT